MEQRRPNVNQSTLTEKEKEKINSNWKAGTKVFMSSCCRRAEKLNLPVMQPTVIQALPSVQQALPSLQCTKRRCPTNSPTKNWREEQKSPFSGKIILPSLPRIEELAMPRVERGVIKTADRSKQSLILQTLQKDATQIPNAKVYMRMKKVRRVLPSIHPKETRPPGVSPCEKRGAPSIQPTVVKLHTTCRVTRWALPARLPTIEEETSPNLVEESCAQNTPNTTDMKSKTRALQDGNQLCSQSILQQTRERSGSRRQKEEMKESQTERKEAGKILKNAKKNETCPSLKPINIEGVSRVSTCLEPKANPELSQLEPTSFKQVQGHEQSVWRSSINTKNSESQRKITAVKQPKRNVGPSEERKITQRIAEFNAEVVRRETVLQSKMTIKPKEGALNPLQVTYNLVQANHREEELTQHRKRETFPKFEHTLLQNSPRQPLTTKKKPIQQFSEREASRSGDYQDKEVIFNLQSKNNEPSFAKPSWIGNHRSLKVKWKESKIPPQRFSQRQNEGNFIFKPEVKKSFSAPLPVNMLLKGAFEAMSQRHRRINQFRLQSSIKDRNNLQILTVKPAFPNIQPIQESTGSNPPTVSTAKKIKEAQNTRPNVKRIHTKIQVSKPLPSIQPIIKQALPSVSSSSLQEKATKPMPSV